jgi:hypothetical protein
MVEFHGKISLATHATAVTDTNSAWESSKNRCAAAREAVSRSLDVPVLMNLAATEPSRASDSILMPISQMNSDPISTMTERALLLADALQRRAIMKIAETGLILDEIDRAVAIKMCSNNEGT